MDQLPLKDIHLPESVGFWPPASGWLLLAIGLPVVFLAIFYAFKRWRRKTALKTAASLLAAIRQDKALDCRQTLTALSALMRRVAISLRPADNVAGLSGQAWLAYLDSGLLNAPFTTGVGQCLADAHFRPSSIEELDLEALFNLCEQWLKHQSKIKPTVKPVLRRKYRSQA